MDEDKLLTRDNSAEDLFKQECSHVLPVVPLQSELLEVVWEEDVTGFWHDCLEFSLDKKHSCENCLVNGLPQRCTTDVPVNNDVWLEDTDGVWSDYVFSDNHYSKCQLCKPFLISGVKSCKICYDIAVAKHVKASGKHNFEFCKLPVDSHLNIEAWRYHLQGYSDSVIVDYLQYGWPIGRSVQANVKSVHFNHRGAKEYPSQIDLYLCDGVDRGQILGPLRSDPFDGSLITSPLNTVPKKGCSDRRVILDLSLPKGHSVNDSIPCDTYLGEPCNLHFPRIDALVNLVKLYGKGCHIFKRDLRRAYRQIPVDPGDYECLGYKWKGHIFCDKVLAMGLRSACQACQRVTSGVKYAFQMLGYKLVNYIDDFAGVARPEVAQEAFECLGQLLYTLGLEESVSKAESPSTCMLFLGIMFDSEACTLSIDDSRLLEITELVTLWLEKSCATRRELQSLLGKLNYVAACVRPGRVFISRILELLRGCTGDGVTLSGSFRKDLLWWKCFLPLFNGVRMMPFQEWSAPDEYLTSVVFGRRYAVLLGCRMCSGTIPLFINGTRISHKAVEVLVLMAILKKWPEDLRNKRLKVVCGLQSTVDAVNLGRSKDSFVQSCLREIAFMAAQHEFEIRVVLCEDGAMNSHRRESFLRVEECPMGAYCFVDKDFEFSCEW